MSTIELHPEPLPTGYPEAGGVKGLVLTASGDMYIIRHSVIGVDEYTPSGTLIRTLDPFAKPTYAEGPVTSMAVDPAGNIFIDIYAGYQHRIDEFNPSGAKIASFDWGPPRTPPGIADREDGLIGIAYDPRTRRLYVVNADVNVRPIVSRVRVIAPPRP